MKSLITISLILCFVLFISIFTDNKQVEKSITFQEYFRVDTNEIKIKGFDFTGLRDSIKKHPRGISKYHSKKLWGYIE